MTTLDPHIAHAITQGQPLYIVATMSDGHPHSGQVVGWRYRPAPGSGTTDLVREPDVVGLNGPHYLDHGFSAWTERGDARFFATIDGAVEYMQELDGTSTWSRP